MANNSSITFADIEPHLDLLDFTSKFTPCTHLFYKSHIDGCVDCKFRDPKATYYCLLRLENPHTRKLFDQLRITHPELFV